MFIASLLAAAVSLQALAGDPEPAQRHFDPLTRAVHESAVCDCPGPLLDYVAYRFTPVDAGAAPGLNQSGGLDHITIMRLVNERWGRRFDLGGFDVSGLDLGYLDRWHLWIEQVQVAHGLTPSYTHVAHGGKLPVRGAPRPATRDIGPVSTGILLQCEECDDALCDALRLAVSAQEAIFDGRYRHECSHGCDDPEDEMRTRFIDAIYEGGPGRTGGWTFKIVAQQAHLPELRTVHGKLVPVWGEEILLDLSLFGGGIDSSINLLSVMRAYQVHILRPDGQWVQRQWDINQPRLSSSPPYSPYPPCHASWEAPYNDNPRPGNDICIEGGYRPMP